MLGTLRTILALVAAASLFSAQAMAQDEGQEEAPPGQPDAASEKPPETLENGDGEADATDPAVDPEKDPAIDTETDDSDLDDQTYESDDDVFVPSEEIPADEPIPFPSDI